MNGHAEVIVIGAGLAGLTCGHLLVKRGLDVLVLEAKGRVGGRPTESNCRRRSRGRRRLVGGATATRGLALGQRVGPLRSRRTTVGIF
jgi:monoamine oxidase